MSLSDTGIMLLSALRKARSKSALYETPLDYFKDDEKLAFEWLRDFVEEHNEWPTPATFKNVTGLSTRITNEPLGYYVNEAREKTLWEALAPQFKLMRDGMESRKPDAVLQTMRDSLQSLSSLQNKRSGLVTLSSSISQVQDDYMIAKRSFGLRGIPTGFPFLDEATDGWQNANLYTLVARPGRGKALSMDAGHLMRDGKWKRNDELKVGDKLASVDGHDNVITALHPQGVRQAYKVTFSDGRSVVADLDHLWQIRCDRWTIPNRVMTTRQLITASKIARNKGRLAIPLCDGNFGHDYSLPLDPWLLGALIGDGCFRGRAPTFSTADDEILQRVKDTLPGTMRVVHMGNYNYALYAGQTTQNLLIRELKRLQLWGSFSCDKFIPDAYLNADRRSRLMLLQGLMDTDGTVSTDGRIEFATSSPRLADHVQYLARSLGGLAKISIKKTTHLDCYRVGIRIKNPSFVFALTRKANRVDVENQYSLYLAPKLVSIERVEDQPMQCISVSHPSSLYITNDFIVTHNTWKLLREAKAAHDAGFSVVFLTMEMGIVQVARRFFGMEIGVNPKLLREGKLSTAIEREMQRQANALAEDYQGPGFWWLAGNFEKSVEALKAAVYETGADMIFADASYLMKPADRTKFNARHEILGDVMRGLQDLTTATNRPLRQSVQFNRMATRPTKKADDDDNEHPLSHMGLEKIAGSDEIGQLSAIVEGIDLGMSPNEVTQRIAALLKGREGEAGWYIYNYLFQPFNMAQITDNVQFKLGSNRTAANSTSVRDMMA